jgi:hypothetical protein
LVSIHADIHFPNVEVAMNGDPGGVYPRARGGEIKLC